MGQPFQNFPQSGGEPPRQQPQQPQQPYQQPPQQFTPYGAAPQPQNTYDPVPPSVNPQRVPLSLPGWVPGFVPRDPVILGLVGAAALFGSICLCAACLILFVINRPVPEPAAQNTIPTTDPGNSIFPTSTPGGIFVGPTLDPNLFTTPTGGGDLFGTPGTGGNLFGTPGVGGIQPTIPFNPSVVGTAINPYERAGLLGMSQLSMDILDPATGQYVNRGVFQAGSAEMAQFETALNIGNIIVQPDPACPDHVRLTAARANNTPITFGLCLKPRQVLLRGPITELGGADFPLGPYAIDVLTPYLPVQYQQLLGQ